MKRNLKAGEYLIAQPATGPLYKDKDVAVIGCGNSGLQEGEAILKYAKSVTFVEFLPNSMFLEDLVNMDKADYIKTDDDMKAKTDGIYAVGDVRSKKVRQIDVVCGEATIAAISARDYINKLK